MRVSSLSGPGVLPRNRGSGQRLRADTHDNVAVHSGPSQSAACSTRLHHPFCKFRNRHGCLSAGAGFVWLSRVAPLLSGSGGSTTGNSGGTGNLRYRKCQLKCTSARVGQRESPVSLWEKRKHPSQTPMHSRRTPSKSYHHPSPKACASCGCGGIVQQCGHLRIRANQPRLQAPIVM
jgi:hypothetical protein